MMYLSSFSMIEPDDNIYLYYPNWVNVWESHMYNRALKSTQSCGWGFKRFGTSDDIYHREMIRSPAYKKYIDAMEQVCDSALQQLSTKDRMRLMKSRTAFIYVDSWGEASTFENISSTIHAAMIDTIPKNLVKKFAITDFTCKIRGEKQSLTQAMNLAQDYLDWDVFDYVVICAAYRAIPVLVFSAEDIINKEKKQSDDIKMNLSIERTGCFIFSREPNGFMVNCGRFTTTQANNLSADNSHHDSKIDIVASSTLRKNPTIESYFAQLKNQSSNIKSINLVDIYGESGCLSPALSWIYLQEHGCSPLNIRTITIDNFGGCNYFDTKY